MSMARWRFRIFENLEGTNYPPSPPQHRVLFCVLPPPQGAAKHKTKPCQRADTKNVTPSDKNPTPGRGSFRKVADGIPRGEREASKFVSFDDVCFFVSMVTMVCGWRLVWRSSPCAGCLVLPSARPLGVVSPSHAIGTGQAAVSSPNANAAAPARRWPAPGPSMTPGGHAGLDAGVPPPLKSESPRKN